MSEPLRMRRAEASDAPLAASIAEAAYAEYLAVLDRPPVPVTDDHAARIAAGEMWIALCGADPAGMLVLETEADHLAIFSIAILPAHQRKGLGQFMLHFAEQQARAAGLGVMRLYTNAKMVRNIAVYTRAGYAETGRRGNPQRPGWVIVDMEKRLED